MERRTRSVGTLLLVALGVWPASCRGRDHDARAEAAMLRRQIAALQQVAETQKRGILPSDQLVIGVKAELARALLQRHLPLETGLVDRLRIRLETAEVAFEDGESLVTLESRVFYGDSQAPSANVLLLGSLSRFDVDARSGILTTHVELDRVEIERLDGGALDQDLRQGLADAVGGRSLSALGEVVPALEIPVRLDHRIDFSGIADDTLSVPPGQLPTHVTVHRALPAAGRLWIFLGVRSASRAVTR